MAKETTGPESQPAPAATADPAAEAAFAERQKTLEERERDYPFHERVVRVTRCGRICIGKRKINVSTVFAGQLLGIREVDDQIWLVSFMDYDLGYIDLEQRTLQTIDNPFCDTSVSLISGPKMGFAGKGRDKKGFQ